MKIKFKDLSSCKIEAIESDEFPRLDDEIFDIKINGKTALRGVSGRDDGLSDLFWSWFEGSYETDETPSFEHMAEFRVSKLFDIINEAKRLAKEFDVEFNGEIHFTGKRNHPHIKHVAKGDKIVSNKRHKQERKRGVELKVERYIQHPHNCDTKKVMIEESEKETND